MKEHKSPVPEALQWIPSVINMLDDAQDLLYTALVIGKWLAPRVFLRMLPGLGWILVVNDALNVGTALLGTALAGRSMKKGFMESIELITTRRGRRLLKARKFLEKTPMFPFIVQAGQAMTTLTGYGLSLGAAMGTVTDSIWGVIRAAQGEKVLIKGPPPADPLGKAVRFLSQTPQQVFMQDVLSPEDHAMLIAAHCVALEYVQQYTSSGALESKHNALMETRVPAFRPWNDASKEALEQEGFDPDDDSEDEVRAHYPTTNPFPTFAEALSLSSQYVFSFEQHMADMHRFTTRGTALCGAWNQANLDNWRHQAADDKVYQPFWTDFELDAGAAIEFSVFPLDEFPPEIITAWLQTARGLSLQQGYTRASFENLKIAAEMVLGGWQRKPYETLHMPPSKYPYPKVTGDLYYIIDCESGIIFSFAGDEPAAMIQARNYQALFPDKKICIKDPFTGKIYPAPEA